MVQNEPELRKRKVLPSDIQALQRRAAEIGKIGAPTTQQKIEAQSDAAYELALDFWRIGLLGQDFPRWMSVHSGMTRSTCYRRLRQGRFRFQQRQEAERKKRNGQGMLAEQRERELTPRPDLRFDDEDE